MDETKCNVYHILKDVELYICFLSLTVLTLQRLSSF